MEQKYGKKRAGKSLSIELEPQFLQHQFIAFQFGEKSSAIISVAGLKHPYTVFRCAVGHPFLTRKLRTPLVEKKSLMIISACILL